MLSKTRQLVASAALCVLAAARVAAQAAPYDPPFEPQFAASQAVGNAGIASGTGFSSLYLNPAGLVAAKPTFTIASLSSSLYFWPTSEAMGRAAAAWNNPGASSSLLAPFGSEGGFGGGGAFGIGYTGSGLGLGLILSGDAYAPPQGGTLGNATAVSTLAFIGGLGFKLGEHLSVGGDVRPMARIEVPGTPVGNLLSVLQSSRSSGATVSALYGVGVGLDLGARLSYRQFSYGIALRDIAGTTMSYEQESLSSLGSALGSGAAMGGGAAGIQYEIPMSLIAGVSFHPDLGSVSSIIDPSFEVDYQYFVMTPSPLTQESPEELLLSGLRAGVDLRLARFLSLRAGYAQGRASAGFGIRLPVVDLDATAFSKVAAVTSTLPERGVAVGVTLHF